MDDSSRSIHLATPAELKQRIEAERQGAPFVVYRDGTGAQRVVSLPDAGRELTIGRDEEANVRLDWDSHVSGLHAELRRTGGRWLVVDDGLSRNGTFVNDERVVGRRQLRDGDQLRLGHTVLIFRTPVARRRKSTALDSPTGGHLELSPAQRRVLIALCRPFGEGDAFTRPATNRQIADELHLTVAAVKTHLRILFQRFGLDELPQNEKRARLVRQALRSGAVSSADLAPPP
jgi:pSer/pThr/pTyr-binding forkhead associated (FHA) protein